MNYSNLGDSERDSKLAGCISRRNWRLIRVVVLDTDRSDTGSENNHTKLRRRMPWNSRWMRVLVGVLLLSAAILAVLPSFTGYTSLDGTVNARFAVVSAPIE